MSRQVVTIGTSDSCREAVARMHKVRIRHLPVVDRDGLLVGIMGGFSPDWSLLDPQLVMI